MPAQQPHAALTITQHNLDVDDLPRTRNTLDVSTLTHITSVIEYADRPIVDSRGFILGHRFSHLIAYHDQPVLNLKRNYASVRLDNELTWRQQVRALNALDLKINGRPAVFFTAAAHSVSGRSLGSESRELWFKHDFNRDGTLVPIRIGEYSPWIGDRIV